MMGDIRIAAVVCPCPVGQLDDNLEQVRRFAHEAHRKGAAMVCFPEMNLTGYSHRPEMAAHAIHVPGPWIERLVRVAADLGVVLLVGFAEKGENGALYASHLVATPQGRTAVYRKVHLAPPEAEHFRAGQHLPVFHWAGVCFGIQLCYDAHFPELSTCMAEAGADLIFIPHASPRGQAADKHQSWMRHLPARAFDNALFVVACNQSGDNRNGLTFPGNAVVVAPSGEILATRLSGTPGMLVVDLARDRIQQVRDHRMRYFLPHRRPWIYGQPADHAHLDP